MRNLVNAVFGFSESNTVLVSRTGMVVILSLILAMHGMILAI
jgi:hypothetical protein